MCEEHILIVEDDVDINNLISTTLKKRGFKVTQAFSGSEASLCLSMKDFDMILLDLMLPGLSGEEVIKDVREKMDIPVIVISAKTSLDDKVNLLNLGVDDYITKPFELDEIVARINAQLRRYRKFNTTTKKEDKSNEIIFKDLILNEESRSVTLKKEIISLTSHEFDILNILMKNPDKVYSRESLYEQVWKSGYYGEDNTVNVHISNIRKKIKEIDKDKEYIKTVWGIGFKLDNN